MTGKVFHPGQIATQERAGTRRVADELGRFLSSGLTPDGAALVSTLRFSILGGKDSHGKLWASLVFGEAGHAKATSDCQAIMFNVGHGLPLGDPLWDGLNAAGEDGLTLAFLTLRIDTRRRLRVMGNGVLVPGEHEKSMLRLNVTSAFPNCPKYIQRRDLEETSSSEIPLTPLEKGKERVTGDASLLTDADWEQITTADTLFFATTHPKGGNDENQRGGRPGFVRRTGPTSLAFSDYRGNGMQLMLGNLHDDPNAGVTFLEFHTGRLLQLSGVATVDWDARADDTAELAAERVIRFDIHKVCRSDTPATNYRWKLIEPSPYNPLLRHETPDEVNPSGFPTEVTLVKIFPETDQVKTFRFLASRRIPFRPGQYASFEFPRTSTMKNLVGSTTAPLVRTWTLSEAANSNEGDVTLEISVKRKEGGVVTPWLHDYAQQGLKVKLTNIGGDMTPLTVGCDAKASKHLLLLSAGIGITPMAAIVRGFGEGKDHPCTEILLVHQERSMGQIAFQKELWRRARLAPEGRFRIVACATTEAEKDGAGVVEGGPCVQVKYDQRVDHALLSQVTSEGRNSTETAWKLVLCGPIGWMAAMREAIAESGIPLDGEILTEEFTF